MEPLISDIQEAWFSSALVVQAAGLAGQKGGSFTALFSGMDGMLFLKFSEEESDAPQCCMLSTFLDPKWHSA
jgi:hypothetical protein